MNKLPNQVFVDSSFFKAFVDSKDDFHERALLLRGQFRKDGIKLVTSNFILDETFTLIRIKSGLSVALELRESLADSLVVKIMRVTVSDEAKAWEWFVKDWSKLSFTDCVSFAMMQRLGLEKVASFDEDFKRAGFTLFS